MCESEIVDRLMSIVSNMILVDGGGPVFQWLGNRWEQVRVGGYDTTGVESRTRNKRLKNTVSVVSDVCRVFFDNLHRLRCSDQ